jgi:hypothetical protein
MRSNALIASSLVTAASVAADATYASCTATCQPLLAVSTQCGLPVPANPNNAFNPAAWTSANWMSPSFWASGMVPFGGPNQVGWANAAGSAAAAGPGPGAWGGPGGGWGGYGGGAGGYGAPFGGAGVGGGVGGGANWAGGSWNLAAWLPAQTNCVCTTKAFDLNQVGGACTACLAQVNALANPCEL